MEGADARLGAAANQREACCGRGLFIRVGVSSWGGKQSSRVDREQQAEQGESMQLRREDFRKYIIACVFLTSEFGAQSFFPQVLLWFFFFK